MAAREEADLDSEAEASVQFLNQAGLLDLPSNAFGFCGGGRVLEANRMSYAPRHPICDVCGEPKRQTNHWFQARISSTQITLEAFDAKSKSVKHLCGVGCAVKMLSSKLSSLHDVPGVVLAAPAIISRNAEGAITANDEPIEFPILPEQQSPAPEVASVCERAKTG